MLFWFEIEIKHTLRVLCACMRVQSDSSLFYVESFCRIVLFLFQNSMSSTKTVHQYIFFCLFPSELQRTWHALNYTSQFHSRIIFSDVIAVCLRSRYNTSSIFNEILFDIFSTSYRFYFSLFATKSTRNCLKWLFKDVTKPAFPI